MSGISLEHFGQFIRAILSSLLGLCLGMAGQYVSHIGGSFLLPKDFGDVGSVVLGPIDASAVEGTTHIKSPIAT